MIAIVNTADITGIELNDDWSILDYDTGTEESSGLASIQYTTIEPEFAVQLFSEEEYKLFKTSNVWKV